MIFIVVALLATTQTFSQCACCAAAGAGSSNGDYSNGVLTLQKNLLVVEAYGDYRTIHASNAPVMDEQLLKSMFISSVGLRYGITNNITISALVPYVFLHTNTGDDNGISDLFLMGMFNVYSKNNFNFALQAGVKLPTGIQKSSNFDNSTVIIGSGSYDPLFGAMVAKRWNKITLLANGFFKYTTQGFHNNYYGKLTSHNLSLSYKIKSPTGVCALDSLNKNTVSNIGWSVTVGYCGEWIDKTIEDDVVDPNSGGYSGFATLGTNFSFKKWSFPLTVSLPVVSKLNGIQNDAGYRIRLGIIKSF